MNSMLSRVRAAAEQMVTSPEPAHARTAIIDIGSNSVRLVIYDGPRRIPFILFNAKVMAGLGASLARPGLTAAVGRRPRSGKGGRERARCYHSEAW